MPRRSSIAQVSQLRVESTVGVDPGTGTKRLKSMSFQPVPAADVTLFRPASGLYPTVQSLGREWSTSAVPDSPPLFDEIPYALASIVGPPVITTPGGATTARQQVFTAPTNTGQTPQSFTVEVGSSAGAEKATGMILNDYHVNLTRQAIAAGGTAFGQVWTPGITLAGSPTTLPQIPILPKYFDFYADTTFAGLGTTKLTANFRANFSITNRWGQIWPINSAKASWDDVTETEPTVTLAIQVENNATGQAFVTYMRSGSLVYCRLVTNDTVTPLIETGQHYTYKMDFVGAVSVAPGAGNTDGLYVLDVTLRAMDDGTHAPFTITTINTVAAL